MTTDDPPTPGPSDDSALPSVRARVIAFGSIIASGLVGAAVGYWFVLLQCHGDCTVPGGLAMIAGSLVGSLGAALIATLALRMLPEWNATH